MESSEQDEIRKALNEASKSVAVETQIITKSAEQIQAEKEITEWKGTSYGAILDKDKFSTLTEIISVLKNNKEYHGLLIKGRGGFGKTLTTNEAVKSLCPAEAWDFFNGHISALSLYEFLFRNRDKEMVILDDIDTLLKNPASIAIIKACLWDTAGKRIVQYNSKSPLMKDLPPQFIMNAKLIIICNKVPNEKDVSMSALINRTITFDMSFSYDEALSMMEEFIQHRTDLAVEQKIEIMRIIKTNTSQAVEDFSFRTLKKAIAFVTLSSRAEELFKSTTTIDKIKSTFLEAINLHAERSYQIQYFMERTGMSRRKFYYLCEELCANVQKK